MIYTNSWQARNFCNYLYKTRKQKQVATNWKEKKGINKNEPGGEKC